MKQTRHITESQRVAISTEAIEYFWADSDPSMMFLRILSTELNEKYDITKIRNAKKTVLATKFSCPAMLNLTLNFAVDTWDLT